MMTPCELPCAIQRSETICTEIHVQHRKRRPRYKARLVLRSSTQREGVTFHEVYAVVTLLLHDALLCTDRGKIHATNLPKWFDKGRLTVAMIYN